MIKKPEVENLSEIFGSDSEDEPAPKKKPRKQSKRKKRAPTPETEEVSQDEAAEEVQQVDSDYSIYEE